MRSILIAGAAAVTLTAVAVFAQSPIREGRWEITMQMQMPNMPMQMPAQKMVQCITKKDLEDPGNALPGRSNPTDKTNPCKVSDHKVSGNKVTWNMACTGRQPMTGSGEIVVDGDSYNGTMKMNSEKGEMTMKYAAKRLGDCTE